MTVQLSSVWEKHPKGLDETISLGYKRERVRLLFELKDSPDPVVQNTKIQVPTGRKWDASQTVHLVIAPLKHQEVVGLVQHSRVGLQWGTALKMWSKASGIERKKLVISEVMREERKAIKRKPYCWPILDNYVDKHS